MNRIFINLISSIRKYEAILITMFIFLFLSSITWILNGDAITIIGHTTGIVVCLLCICALIFYFIPCRMIPAENLNIRQLEFSALWLTRIFLFLFALGYFMYIFFKISPSNYESILHSLSNVVFDVGTGCSAICACLYKIINCYWKSKNKEVESGTATFNIT